MSAFRGGERGSDSSVDALQSASAPGSHGFPNPSLRPAKPFALGGASPPALSALTWAEWYSLSGDPGSQKPLHRATAAPKRCWPSRTSSQLPTPTGGFELPGGDPARAHTPPTLPHVLRSVGATPSLWFACLPFTPLARSPHQPGSLDFYVQKVHQVGI